MSVTTENETLRHQAQDAAKRHKASWIELGQYLFSIHNDKLFKTWGFLSFETYCKKELGIKDTTASKLLKSYAFLEKEEPRIVGRDYFKEEEQVATLPHFESVNLLRLARQNEKIKPQEYSALRKSVIESAKEPQEVRAQVRQIVLAHDEEKDPVAVRRSRRNTAIRRLVSLLFHTKRELEREHLLPDYLLKQMSTLVEKLEDQIEE